jgi:hypothetical protein
MARSQLPCTQGNRHDRIHNHAKQDRRLPFITHYDACWRWYMRASRFQWEDDRRKVRLTAVGQMQHTLLKKHEHLRGRATRLADPSARQIKTRAFRRVVVDSRMPHTCTGIRTYPIAPSICRTYDHRPGFYASYFPMKFVLSVVADASTNIEERLSDNRLVKLYQARNGRSHRV